jgi:hypothetical protein
LARSQYDIEDQLLGGELALDGRLGGGDLGLVLAGERDVRAQALEQRLLEGQARGGLDLAEHVGILAALALKLHRLRVLGQRLGGHVELLVLRGEAEPDGDLAAGRQLAAQADRAADLLARQRRERRERVGRGVGADRVDLEVGVGGQLPGLVLAGRDRLLARGVTAGHRTSELGRQPDRDTYNVVELERRDRLGLGAVAVVVRGSVGRGARVRLRPTARLGSRRERGEGPEHGGDRSRERGETVHGG